MSKRRIWVEMLVVSTLTLIAVIALYLYAEVQVKLALAGGSDLDPASIGGEFSHIYFPASPIGFLVPFYGVPMVVLLVLIALDYRRLGEQQ